MQHRKFAKKGAVVLVVLTVTLTVLGSCGYRRSWEGHTISVHYSWDPNTRTRIVSMTDVASGEHVNDPQLSGEIAKKANRELPYWIQLQKLSRATGVFHAVILHNGAIEIDETMHGIEGATDDFVKDPDVTPEMTAAHEGKLAKLRELVEGGGPVNAKDQRGDTALMAAVSSRDIGVLQFLLRHGAEVDARNQEGDSALTLSVMSGQADMAKELAKHGALLDCKNPVDRSAFESENRRNRMPRIIDKVTVNCHNYNSR